MNRSFVTLRSISSSSSNWRKLVSASVQPPIDAPADYEGKIDGCEPTDVVGPVCESSDYFAKDRYLPPMQRGDLVCTFSAGAYGMAMSSNYNSRPRAVEVLVDGDSYKVIRKRESWADLVAHEMV